MNVNKPNLNVLNDITFIFDASNWDCKISIRGGDEIPLLNKGATNKDGQGYQLDDNLHHGISFNRDKFNNTKIEAFYKRPKDLNNHDKEMPSFYFRKVFKDLERGDSLCVFSYSGADEGIKRPDGKGGSKYEKEKVAPKQPGKNHNDK